MADFNSGFIFNEDPGNGGFFWNGADYMYIINLHEVLHYSDNLAELVAKYALMDNAQFVYDSILQTALYNETESFMVEDDVKIGILFEIMDSFGVKDEFSELIVNLFLRDEIKLLEEIKLLAAKISVDEEINVEDITDLTVLHKLLDKFGLEDLRPILSVLFNINDSFEMDDEEPPPQLAETDWLIGTAGNLDRAYDWFLPFGMKVDWGNTKIQVMPEAENITVEVPGTDGSMVVDTVYKDRLFNVVAFSEQGLTIKEKEDLKTKISNILASTKTESKVLTIQSRGNKFNVRYSGQANITEGPSYVKATIPLMADVYGYNLFPNEITGSGLLKNSGVIATGPMHVIKGPCAPFSFSMGSETYRYSNSIPEGSTLTISNEMKSVWITDANGKQINVLKYFSGVFQKVLPGKSVVITVPDSIKEKFITSWFDPVLW